MPCPPRLLWSVLALSIFALAGPAGARTFSMTGTWWQNRGPLVDIPIGGGPFPCAGTAATGCIGGLRPASGIPGSGIVKGEGSGPATFTIPPSLFARAATMSSVAVAINPTVIQLGSSFSAVAPAPGRMVTTFLGGTIPPPASTRVFKANAHLMPAQAPRAAANFAWCPGVGGPACPAGGAGIYPGFVRYTAGTNAFGGTMTLLLAGDFTISIALPTTPLLLHQPGGVPPASPESQAQGRGYASTDTDLLGPSGAPLHSGFMTGPACTNPLPPLPVGCGLITTSGPQLGVGPPDSNLNYGFPWTTGQVTVTVTGTNMGNPVTTVLTAMGTDMRTPLGAGTITLVAGGYTHRFGIATLNPQNFVAIDVVHMDLTKDTPSLSPAGLAAGAVLMVLAVGYALRRRL
jgi:hypothetical protein